MRCKTVTSLGGLIQNQPQQEGFVLIILARALKKFSFESVPLLYSPWLTTLT